MNYDEKSESQMRIELLVTNTRGYQKIPYSKILGQKKALQQWLRFSNSRAYNFFNTKKKRVDNTSLTLYLGIYLGVSLGLYFKEKILLELVDLFAEVNENIEKITDDQ